LNDAVFPVVNGVLMGKKLLSCLFLPDVLCSYRKTEKFGVMDRCVKCRHYETFMSEMEDEEDRFFEELERARRGEPHG